MSFWTEKKSQHHAVTKIPTAVFHLISENLEPKDCEILLGILPALQPLFHLAPINYTSKLYQIPSRFKLGQVEVICRNLNLWAHRLRKDPDDAKNINRLKGVQSLSFFSEYRYHADKCGVINRQRDVVSTFMSLYVCFLICLDCRFRCCQRESFS